MLTSRPYSKDSLAVTSRLQTLILRRLLRRVLFGLALPTRLIVALAVQAVRGIRPPWPAKIGQSSTPENSVSPTLLLIKVATGRNRFHSVRSEKTCNIRARLRRGARISVGGHPLAVGETARSCICRRKPRAFFDKSHPR